jgi:hypothetical protein
LEEIVMSLNVVANDHGGFGLYRGEEQVGWVEGRAVALLGFETADEAQRAAGAALDALRGWLARQRRTDFVPGPRRALRAQRDGSRTKLTLGKVPIGRIIEPNDAVLNRVDYGFELLLPPGMGSVAGISAAQIIDMALTRRSAVRGLEPAVLAT